MPSSTIEKQVSQEWNTGEGRNTEKYTSDEKTEKHFSIDIIQFPEYLGTKELNQYILFNINVRGKSKLKIGNEKRIAVVKRTNTANLTEDQLASGKTVSTVALGATVGLAAGTIVSKLMAGSAAAKLAKTGMPNDALQQSIQKAQGLIAQGAGVILGAAVGKAINSTELFEADKSYRLSDAIALYISEPPQVKYSAMYDNKELGTLAGLVGGLSSASSIGDAVKNMGPEGLGALGMTMAKLPQSMGLGSPQDVISASAKITINPFKEVLFTGIDFRSFSFKYKFMPKSKQEANQVRAIIEKFKFHMHPELSENKLFFIYPSEFEISYIFKGKHNEYFHKFKPCVLESMDINYGGEQYSSFTDGNPTEINLSLVFRETEILTKQQILDGY